MTARTRTLYHHPHKLAGRRFYPNLWINGHRRYRHRNKAGLVKIPNRRDISERPAIVESRTRYGD